MVLLLPYFYSLFSLTTGLLPMLHDSPSDNIERAPVIVELFTSQGCSSCPSADQLLSKLVKEAESSNRPVYGLSFHVSYWNYLGWNDPYSKEQFTKRQRAYASKFRNNSIYTPQMVVHGKKEFVGSNERTARSEINHMAERSAVNLLSAQIIDRQTHLIHLNVRVDSAGKAPLLLNIALVEKGLSNFIPRGENKGLTLQHDNVVRHFQFNKINQREQKIEIPVLADIDQSKSSIIIFVQDEHSMAIGDAIRLKL
jgi:hypothetical protein